MFRCAVLDDYQHVARKFGDWDSLAGKVDVRVYHDHFSSDETVALARTLGLSTFVHEANYGYGRNQMTCYREALRVRSCAAIGSDHQIITT